MTRYDLTDDMGNAKKNSEASRFTHYFSTIISFFNSLPPALGYSCNMFWPSEDRRKNDCVYKPRIRLESWNEAMPDLTLCIIYSHKYIAVRYRTKPGQKGKQPYVVTIEDRTGNVPSDTFSAKNQKEAVEKLKLLFAVEENYGSNQRIAGNG